MSVNRWCEGNFLLPKRWLRNRICTDTRSKRHHFYPAFCGAGQLLKVYKIEHLEEQVFSKA